MLHTCRAHRRNMFYVTLTFLHLEHMVCCFLKTPLCIDQLLGGHGILFLLLRVANAGFLYFLYTKGSKGNVRCADRVIKDPELMIHD